MMEDNNGSLSSIVAQNGVLSKRKLRSGSAAADLSDISDAEITGYLNNKTEMLFKKLMWEAMNKDYNPQKKQRRRPATGKKPCANKAVAVTKEKVTEKEVKKKRQSSKINYAALEKLTDEFG